MRLGGHLFTNLGPPDSNPSHRSRVGFDGKNITSSWTTDTKTRMTLQNTASSASGNRPNPDTLHQPEPSLRLIRDQRDLWRLRYGYTHLSLFFLLIDVDRTGSARSCPALRSGKHKYGFHAFYARTLRICACDRSLAPVPNNPHRKKERPK